MHDVIVGKVMDGYMMVLGNICAVPISGQNTLVSYVSRVQGQLDYFALSDLD